MTSTEIDNVIKEVEELQRKLRAPMMTLAPISHPSSAASSGTQLVNGSRPILPQKPALVEQRAVVGVNKSHAAGRWTELNIPPAPPPEHLRDSKPRDITDPIPFRLAKFDEVYGGHEDRPIILKKDHIRAIDWIRKDYNRKKLYREQESLTTTDVINAALDVVFSHPGVPFVKVDEKENLPRFICDEIHKTAVSHWRQFNEAFPSKHGGFNG